MSILFAGGPEWTWSHPRRQILKLSHLIPGKEITSQVVCAVWFVLVLGARWQPLSQYCTDGYLGKCTGEKTNYSCNASGIERYEESNV